MRCNPLRAVLPALALSALVAVPASAQFGGAVGVRSVAGNEAVAANSDRSGFELRAFWEGIITPTWGWRAEVAGTQMQFRRDDGTQRFAVSENGIEVSAAARASFGGGSLSGLYGLAGPVYSLRVLCGTSGRYSPNGRVACDEGEDQELGYQLGLGFASRVARSREMLFELRYIDGVVAGAGNPVVALSIGLRWR